MVLDCLELQRRAARLAAAGAVGASVAHELRNALAVAESSLYLAQRDIDDRTRLQQHLGRVTAEIRKAHEVIGSVLGLARGEPLRREPVSIGDLIESARHAHPAPATLAFEVSVQPEKLTVSCDPILIERVLSNLYLNAIEAIGDAPGGLIATRVWTSEERVHVEVADNGPGIDPRVEGRLFEPLVTAKPRGTGLGLSLTRIIVEAHGGEISAKSGRGAVFRIWLPS